MAWPGNCYDARRALKILIKHPGKKRKAYFTVPHSLKTFFVSAYQSHVFNRVLTARMPEIDTLLTGDMAYKHENGACFRVDNASAEQARCDRFEISPTGPMFGGRLTRLTDQAGAVEEAILQAEQVDQYKDTRANPQGGRRPLRFELRDLEMQVDEDKHGDFLELIFEINSGCYATVVLREIMKKDVS
jgi:tRNA pseudouridine13 synthase